MINNDELIKIEELENKYLKKYYHFLKFVEEEIINGLQTKNDIKNDWFEKWSNSSDTARKSDFSTGAERVVYALINSKSFGVPNSCPVGSDLMFEMEDAYIHIDLKTTQTRNIRDFAKQFTLGNNQISYNTTFFVSGSERKYSNANLPIFYTKQNGVKKICLTYFLHILHDEETLQTIMSYITCFPNGQLESVYKDEAFNAGKITSDVRANIEKILNFKLINARRTLVLYKNNDIINKFDKKLSFLLECLDTQKI
jgi:hypothetical protein